MTTYYRYVSQRYAPPYDEYGSRRGAGRLAVELRTYKVIKVTPCGVRLDNGRFVNTQRIKQFAHATPAAALDAFVARQKRYAGILSARLADAEVAVRIAEHLASEVLKSGGVTVPLWSLE